MSQKGEVFFVYLPRFRGVPNLTDGEIRRLPSIPRFGVGRGGDRNGHPQRHPDTPKGGGGHSCEYIRTNVSSAQYNHTKPEVRTYREHAEGVQKQ